MFKFLFKLKILFFLLVNFLFIFQSCDYISSSRDPLSGPYPYEFKEFKNIRDRGIFKDLDRDGQEEVIEVVKGSADPSGSHSKIILKDSNLKLIDEVPFIDCQIQDPFFFDWDDDDVDEIAIPFTKNDSLYFSLIKNNGDYLFDKFLYSGKPRFVSTGIHPWVGLLEQMEYIDLDGDSDKELVVFADEGYAAAPRGVYVYDGKTFDLKWWYDIGPAISNQVYIKDFDKNGLAEFIIPTSAADNGNVANNTDDKHSYIFKLEYLSDEPIWKKEFGGVFSNVQVILDDYDADGKLDIYALTNQLISTDNKVRFVVFDLNQNQLAKHDFTTLQAYYTSVNLNADLKKEFVLCTKEGEIKIFDNQLNIITEQNINTEIVDVGSCEDLNSDGKDEIVVFTLKQGAYLLDSELNVIAKNPSDYRFYKDKWKKFQIYHDHNGRPTVEMYNDFETILVTLERKPYYLISYYGPPVIKILGYLLFFFLIMFSIYSYKSKRYLIRLFKNTLAMSHLPTLYIDSKFIIQFANVAAQNLFDIKDFPINILTNKNMKYMPNIKSALFKLKNQTESYIEEKIIYENDSRSEIYSMNASPIYRRGKNHPNWIVTYENESTRTDLDKAQAWFAIAQKIAHDIKNPLTSIQLSLQRLQREYLDRDPQNVKVYDQFSEYIIERIEILRKMSRNFMKFLDAENINSQMTDINKFLEELFDNKVIQLPKGIRLKKMFTEDRPLIQIDREQLQILVENFVNNSINAMPEGGIFTLKTNLASDLQFTFGEGSKNYVVVEITDTGIGIPDEIKNRLFKPYVSNTYLGTGLGLTIVKKIVEDHKGKIEVSSEIGIGTSFMVYLPAHKMQNDMEK